VPQQPNVLFLFSDQHRPHAMGCAGDPNVRTPNLDRLAAEGMRFTRAYANTPLCSPFRATLFTGQYATTHGVISLHRPLLPGPPQLPEILRDAGWHTAYMGKWHLAGGAGPQRFVSPYFRPGWNEWVGWENSNRPFATEYTEGDRPNRAGTLPGYQTDALADRAVEWLARQPADRPWFLTWSVEPPHDPNQAPPEYMERVRERPLTLRPNVNTEDPAWAQGEARLRGYYAQVENLDHNIGRLLATLEAAGQLDRTIILYFADHGDLLGSHGRHGKSRPEEESSGMPLIVSYPGTVPAGGATDALASCVDLMPTLLGLLGLPVPARVDGVDLSGVLRGSRAQGRDEVILQYESTFFPAEPEQRFRSLITAEWSYTVYFAGPEMLFHLPSDPYQMNDRAADPASAAVLRDLRARLAQALEDIHDPAAAEVRARA